MKNTFWGMVVSHWRRWKKKWVCGVGEGDKEAVSVEAS